MLFLSSKSFLAISSQRSHRYHELSQSRKAPSSFHKAP